MEGDARTLLLSLIACPVTMTRFSVASEDTALCARKADGVAATRTAHRPSGAQPAVKILRCDKKDGGIIENVAAPEGRESKGSNKMAGRELDPSRGQARRK